MRRRSNAIRTVSDGQSTPDERGAALSFLEQTDTAAALEVSSRLLNDSDGLVRMRAAWILASAGREPGLSALRRIAVGQSEEMNLAAMALGRLRDLPAHDLLATLLASMLAGPSPRADSARISSLMSALAGYGRKDDGVLLAQAIEKVDGLGNSAMVRSLGLTTSPRRYRRL